MSFFCITSEDAKVTNYFKGYAFTDSSLIVNDAGYQKFFNEHGCLFEKIQDGRFLLVEKNNEVFRLRTDPSGQSIVYYYSRNDFWIVSDSLLELSRKLKSFGYNRSIYQPSVDVFKNERLSLIGGQLVSNNTVVQGVKVLGLNSYIEISCEGNDKKITVKEIEVENNYSNYEDFVSGFVSSWRGRLRAISMLNQESYLALSGGVDSRAILALWSSSKALKKINCHSHKKYEVEYDIAQKLCALSNQSFGPGMKGLESLPLSPADSYQLTMLGNASVKTNFGFRRSIITEPQLHFIGGCAVGSFYMKSSYKARAARLTSQFGEAGENVANEILESLKEIGVDKKDPWAMFHHYYNHRARFHYGNNAYTSFGSLQVQPLLDASLHKASNLVDKEYVQGNGLVRDIILLANGTLLGVPFDSPEKVKAGDSLLSGKMVSEKEVHYEVFYGSSDCSHINQTDNIQTESEWYKELKKILGSKKEAMSDFALDLGFNDAYIAQALSEINSFNKKSKLRKAGVLLGIGEIFNS